MNRKEMVEREEQSDARRERLILETREMLNDLEGRATRGADQHTMRDRQHDIR